MKLKTLPQCFVVLFIAATAANKLVADEKWFEFKNLHGKSYGSINEELSRKLIFHENLKKIQEHNRLHELGQKTFTLKVNKFGDLTTEEFKKLMTMTKLPKGKKLNKVHHIPAANNLPASVDWRTKGAVTGIKDQGQYGSISAFSATGALEGLWFLHNGTLVELSEQNLIECVEGEVVTTDAAFKYVGEHGINTVADYPSDGKCGVCRPNEEKAILVGINYKDLPKADEAALASALANIEPVSVAIDAGHFSFQFYQGGIYYEPSCSPYSLDHGALVVGYGSSSAGDYWILKNSWGTNWGQAGYILMARNKNNNCGIASMASYPYL